MEKITKIEILGSRVTFDLNNVSRMEANTLRRNLMDIPTLTIDDVEIFVNTSPIHDEFIAQRLGLIPILSTELCPCELISNGDDVKTCKICCQKYELKVKAPLNRPILNVTSSDLRCLSSGERNLIPDLLLVILAPGQELDLIATTRKGSPDLHIKWSAFDNIWFTPDPIIKDKVKFTVDLTGSIPPKNFIEIVKKMV